jgi:hypothetical protein
MGRRYWNVGQPTIYGIGHVALLGHLLLPNDTDEPRLRLARLLPRRRRDSRGRWLWRLVRRGWLGVHGSGMLSFCRGNETESIRMFVVFGALLGYWRNRYSEELACGG